MNEENKSCPPHRHCFCIRWFYRIMIFIGILTTLASFLAILHSKSRGGKGIPNVAHIKLNGPIVSSSQESGLFSNREFVTSDDFLDIMDDLKDNKEIKGILLEVNSPGGSPVASQEIARAILEAKVPVVAWIREVGASGAYWISMSSTHIICNPMSITGSIGVLANSFGFEDTLPFLKIKFRRHVAGNMKDLGTPFREQTPEENTYFQGVLDQIHGEFIKAFMKARKLDETKAREIANGSFYTGTDALKLNLVDELGGKKEALTWLEKQMKEPARLQSFEARTSLLESLVKGVKACGESFSLCLSNSLLQAVTGKKDNRGMISLKLDGNF